MKETIKISTKDKDAHKTASAIVKGGGIALIPTDTVYGFAADAFNIPAQKNLYAVKGRSYNKPLILMAHSIEDLQTIVSFSKTALKIAKHFFPGRLTLVLPSTPLGKILSGGRGTIGVRIPDNQFMLAFLKEIRKPVWTTSANISNQPSAKTYKDALSFEGIVDIIVDGGRCAFALESTVIDMVGFPYTIIRKGCLDTKEILKVLNSAV